MQQPNLHESILAGRLLMIMAAKVSENLSTFSSWLIGSFAAVLALIITNIEKVSKFVPAERIGTAAFIFLFAVGLHVLQRYLAAIVAASAAAGKEADGLTVSESLNFALVTAEIEKATLWPARLLVRKGFAKIAAGDHAASGRTQALFAQSQGLLVIFQVAFVLSAAYVLARAL